MVKHTQGIPYSTDRIHADARQVVLGPVNKGDIWQFAARGVWHDGFISVGPGGYPNRLARLFGLNPGLADAPLAALCGKIQDAGGRDIDGSQFDIGPGCVWTARHDGQLVVSCNDVKGAWFRNNNSGCITLRSRRLGSMAVSAAHRQRAPFSLATAWSDCLDALQHTQGMLLISALVALAMILLGLPGLGTDIVLAVTESSSAGIAITGHQAAMVSAVLFLSLQAWFWPRRIIEANYGPKKSTWGPFAPVLVWWPRALGLIPHLMAMYLIAQSRPEGGKTELWVAGCLELVACIAFVAFVIGRDRIIAWWPARWQKILARISFGWPLACALFSLMLFIWAWADPTGEGHVMGPSAIVFFAVAGILPYVAILAQAGSAFRLPVAGILLVLYLVCSLGNDAQHEVRPCGSCTLPVSTRPSATAALAAWTQQAQADGRPFFIVATEGGASRAGFWTATALDALQKNNPKFAGSVFAISSISGGSVGAVGWVKALEASQAMTGQAKDTVIDFAGEDALSPAFADGFFPDALQRLLPYAFLPDSANGLEKGWERGWRRACSQCDGLDQPYLKLWPTQDGKPAAGPWRPMVIVGGASQETGERVLTSPFTFGRENLFDARDFYSDAGHDIAQSAAILNGARFPWISPPGRITSVAGDVYHIVDGGYFDNSGIETAKQLMTWSLSQMAPAGQLAAKKPAPYAVMIVISYVDYVDPRPKPKPVTRANDAIGPMEGLLASRDGHEKHMLDRISDDAAAAQGWHVCRIVLKGDEKHKLPVDWVLSSKMQTYALNYALKQADANGGIQQIDDIVAGARPDHLACDDLKPL